MPPSWEVAEAVASGVDDGVALGVADAVASGEEVGLGDGSGGKTTGKPARIIFWIATSGRITICIPEGVVTIFSPVRGFTVIGKLVLIFLPGFAEGLAPSIGTCELTPFFVVLFLVVC